ncbi:hypothetical protein Hdeb2414_s0010g00353081 [Helianthus debilis subsp. tardiflorus]
MGQNGFLLSHPKTRIRLEWERYVPSLKPRHQIPKSPSSYDFKPHHQIPKSP